MSWQNSGCKITRQSWLIHKLLSGCGYRYCDSVNAMETDIVVLRILSGGLNYLNSVAVPNQCKHGRRNRGTALRMSRRSVSQFSASAFLQCLSLFVFTRVQSFVA
jgi:hypothetical protein